MPIAHTSEAYVSAERAIIIWDQAHHIEHFIRQASFSTRSPDLGFLVPTPQIPELAEVDPRIFNMAADIGQPEHVAPIIYHTPWEAFAPIADIPAEMYSQLSNAYEFAKNPNRSSRPEVGEFPRGVMLTSPGVVFEQDVAGYHATVLATDDYPSISTWLANNGYAQTPELKAWLKTYAGGKWKITAFKMIQDTDHVNDAQLTTRAVRLSFSTDQPFYPYSEPSDRQKAAAASPLGRALRVAILSNHRMTGTLADKNVWPGKLEYAGTSMPSVPVAQQMNVEVSSDLTVPLPPQATPVAWAATDWLRFAGLDDGKHEITLPTELTTFLDEANPRPGTADLYFTPDADPSPFRSQMVDYSLAPTNRLVFNQFLPDLGAVLVILLFPLAPLYCGMRTMSLGRLSSLPGPIRPLTSQWLGISDRFWSSIAIIIGTLASIPFGVGFISGVASLISEPGFGIVTAVVCFPFLTMCTAMISCGLRLWRIKVNSRVSVLERPSFVRRWDKMMSVASVVASFVALSGVVLAVATNLPI